ncbi:MAG: hypothetical protein P4N41_06410 [Negativicutes bacterium]|nr:hypothetical protein [Negativicutes bacterium]
MSKQKYPRYYHGGIPGLNPGDMLLPPAVTGKSTLLEHAKEIDPNCVQRADRVYIVTEREMADVYALVYPYGDTYKVRPVGELEHDADCKEPGLSFQCEKAEIIAVIRRGKP